MILPGARRPENSLAVWSLWGSMVAKPRAMGRSFRRQQRWTPLKTGCSGVTGRVAAIGEGSIWIPSIAGEMDEAGLRLPAKGPDGVSSGRNEGLKSLGMSEPGANYPG